MAGLGLSDAVIRYQQGDQWRQQQEQLAKQKERQRIIEEADNEASSVLDADKANWALSGAEGNYKPSDVVMLKAHERRAMALARAGDWESAAKAELAVQPQRTRIRANAWQQYQINKDPVALASAVYPTVFDGKEIVGSEWLRGGGEQKGAPSGPDRIRFKLSDGSTEILEPREIEAMVKMSLMDPVKMAENEVAANLARLKVAIETAGKMEVERVKGKEARLTEDVKAGHARSLEEFKAEQKAALEEQNRAAANERAKMQANATLGSAGIHAKSRVEAARIGADARGDREAGDKVKDSDIVKALKDRGFGTVAGGPFGSTLLGNEDVSNLAVSVREVLNHPQNKGISLTEAVDAVIQKTGKKPPAPKKRGGLEDAR